MTALKQDAYQNALALFERPDSTCMACPSLSLLDGNRHLPLFRNHGLAVVEAMRSSSVEHLPWWGQGGPRITCQNPHSNHMTWLTSCYSNKLTVWTDTIAVTKLYVRFRARFCVFGKFNPTTANMPSVEAKSSH